MNVLIRCIQLLIRAYQLISSLGPPRCRFYPTCSAYAIDALQQWGLWKGLFRIVVRLSKCHPWHAGGVDPVAAD